MDIIHPDDLHPESGRYTPAFSYATDGTRLVIVSGQLGIRQDGLVHEDFEGSSFRLTRTCAPP